MPPCSILASTCRRLVRRRTTGPRSWLSEAEATKNVDWDAALYRSLLSLFCERYQGFGARFSDRIARDPVESLAKDLGRLATGARSLGALPLAGFAEDLKERLQRGGGEEIASCLARLIHALEATILVIEARVRATSDPFAWPAADAGRDPAPRLSQRSAA